MKVSPKTRLKVERRAARHAEESSEVSRPSDQLEENMRYLRSLADLAHGDPQMARRVAELVDACAEGIAGIYMGDVTGDVTTVLQ